jgi:hypothetical protein
MRVSLSSPGIAFYLWVHEGACNPVKLKPLVANVLYIHVCCIVRARPSRMLAKVYRKSAAFPILYLRTGK